MHHESTAVYINSSCLSNYRELIHTITNLFTLIINTFDFPTVTFKSGFNVSGQLSIVPSSLMTSRYLRAGPPTSTRREYKQCMLFSLGRFV